MMKRLSSHLSFFLFIVFALGVICGANRPLFFGGLVLSLTTLGLTYLIYKRSHLFLSDIFILFSFFFLGVISSASLCFYKVDKFCGQETNVLLKVVSIPDEGYLKNTLFAQAYEVDGLPLKFKARVLDFTKKMSYLGSYSVRGKLKKRFYQRQIFFTPLHPESPNLQTGDEGDIKLESTGMPRPLGRGVTGFTLWVKSKSPIEELPQGRWDRFNKKSTNFFLTSFKNNLSDEAGRFLASAFLGRRELLKKENDYFILTGTSHLLAISGMQIGFTSLILFFILQFLNVKFRLSLIISMIFLYIYTFLSGASPSVIRATIMYSIFAVSFFLKRKASPLNALGLAGFISLLIDPFSIFDIGFQLSYGSIFATIVGFKLFSLNLPKNFVLNYLGYTLATSLFVALFISPLVSYYFGKIYILGILYNVILIPFFTFIMMINFIFLVFCPVQFIAQSLGAFLSVLVAIFNYLIRILGPIKLSFLSYRFSLREMAIYYLIFAAASAFLSVKKHRLGNKTC